MIYLLDANAWIVHVRQTSPSLSARLRRQQPGSVVLCSVVLGELHFGALNSPAPKQAANLA